MGSGHIGCKKRALTLLTAAPQFGLSSTFLAFKPPNGLSSPTLSRPLIYILAVVIGIFTAGCAEGFACLVLKLRTSIAALVEQSVEEDLANSDDFDLMDDDLVATNTTMSPVVTEGLSVDIQHRLSSQRVLPAGDAGAGSVSLGGQLRKHGTPESGGGNQAADAGKTGPPPERRNSNDRLASSSQRDLFLSSVRSVNATARGSCGTRWGIFCPILAGILSWLWHFAGLGIRVPTDEFWFTPGTGISLPGAKGNVEETGGKKAPYRSAKHSWRWSRSLEAAGAWGPESGGGKFPMLPLTRETSFLCSKGERNISDTLQNPREISRVRLNSPYLPPLSPETPSRAPRGAARRRRRARRRARSSWPRSCPTTAARRRATAPRRGPGAAAGTRGWWTGRRARRRA